MAVIAPILRVRGKVRQIVSRSVPPVEARPARYDEAGNLLNVAREARPGYTVEDVTVDTDPGGLVEVVFRTEAVADAGGYLPSVGEIVDLPVRAFTHWKGNPGRRFPTNGYSFAGQVYADEAKTRTGGARAAAGV